MSIGVKWVGWDKSQWDLRNGNVHLTDGGLTGLGALKYDEFVQTTAAGDGQRFVGYRGQPRTVLMPVLIGQAVDENAWLTLDRAWWRTMRPDKLGRLTVTAPDGTARYLDLRFGDDGDMPYDRDPSRDRLSVAAIKMTADDPWWKGIGFGKTFSAGTDPVDFFGGEAHQGPPFYIGSANTLGSGELTNPGDVETWPEHIIDGPAEGFNITIDGAPVSSDSFPLTSEQQLVIETSPLRQLATLVTGGNLVGGLRVGGTSENVTKTALKQVEFRPIAEGATAEVEVELNGTGRITITGTPRFFRAWG